MGKFISQIIFVVAVVVCLYVLFNRNKSFNSQNTGSLAAAGNNKTPIRISPEQGKKMMESGNPFILLDVRTEEEFSQGHIAGAVLIPDYEVEEKAPSQIPDKKSTIIVYCRSGRRSAGAAKMLTILGYTNVYDMGGIINWPYDIVQ